jgi:ABC-2 type transport system ATP-binding protein
MTALAIDIKNLTKSFDGLLAVDNLSLQIPQGTICGFLGANGSGKTTTIRMLCGLMVPSSGGGTCLGYSILTESNLIKRKIGYASQKFSFYLDLTVHENLMFIAGIYQIAHVTQSVNQVIHDLNLVKYQNVRARNLSGGWRQVLALACCLVHSPELLVLDEPTAGVDPKMRRDFWDFLHDLSQKSNTTILVTTHYMDEVERCQQLVYISHGKLLYSGIPNDIIPFSKVISYISLGNKGIGIDDMHVDFSDLVSTIKHEYPQVSITFMGNDLRISSIDSLAMEKIIKKNKKYHFTQITPSFEEIFIRMMQA